MAKLRERFKDEPIFAEVIDAILEMDQDTNLRTKKHARHRASEYMIENGKFQVATTQGPSQRLNVSRKRRLPS